MQDFGDVPISQIAHALQNVSPQSVDLLEKLSHEEAAKVFPSAAMDHAKDAIDEDE
jgi:hypothetical protein